MMMKCGLVHCLDPAAFSHSVITYFFVKHIQLLDIKEFLKCHLQK